MVRDERPRRGATGNRLHHRRLYFDEASGFEEVAQFADDLSASRKDLPHSLVDNQIQVALAVAEFDVGQPVPFFRQGQQRLGQQSQFLHPERQLIGLGAEKMPGDADDVAHVQELEQPEASLAHHVQLDVDL